MKKTYTLVEIYNDDGRKVFAQQDTNGKFMGYRSDDPIFEKRIRAGMPLGEIVGDTDKGRPPDPDQRLKFRIAMVCCIYFSVMMLIIFL